MPLLDYEDEIIDGKMTPAPKLPPHRKVQRRAWRIPLKKPLFLLFKLVINIAVLILVFLLIRHLIS